MNKNENAAVCAPAAADRQALKDALVNSEKERQMLNALCINYTAAYCCDLKNDSMKLVKQKGFSHCAQERQNMKDPLCYSEWIHYAYENFVIKETAPDYLEVFNADNLMQHLQTA